MYEKVNPQHPDKVADRIAGAIVDYAYSAAGGLESSNPRIAVEVLIGHNMCTVVIEAAGAMIVGSAIEQIVMRICPDAKYVDVVVVPQDSHLSDNQREAIRCGDNGIFRGVPVTQEQAQLAKIARELYKRHPSDGKYIINFNQAKACYEAIVCQSGTTKEQDGAIREMLQRDYGIIGCTINPLGQWTGGINVDTGATNRKLGSDMGDAVTGGGLHGKDLSKADVSVNIICHMMAQIAHQRVEAVTAIGDEEVTFRFADGTTDTQSYSDVVERARRFILEEYGSFEAFAEWGLIC